MSTELKVVGGTSCDVAVLGAGYAGLMAAPRLARGSGGRRRIVLISERQCFLERVRLQESIVGDVVPRFPPFREFLARSPIVFIQGRIASLDAARRRILVVNGRAQQEIAFDEAVYALGSGIDVATVPGVHEHAYRLEPGDGSRFVTVLRQLLKMRGGQPTRVASSL